MPGDDSGEWARICRIEAAWTSHPSTRNLLLTLADEFDATPSELAKNSNGAPVPSKNAIPRHLGKARREASSCRPPQGLRAGDRSRRRED